MGNPRAEARGTIVQSSYRLYLDRLTWLPYFPFSWLSGESVRELMRNRPVELSDLLVIDDDVNLDIGRLRIRDRGSHGGHNGLRSVIERLGSPEFARLRTGVRSGAGAEDLARYVLTRPPPEDRGRLEAMVEVAADAAEYWIREGAQAAASRFNGFRDTADG